MIIRQSPDVPGEEPVQVDPSDVLSRLQDSLGTEAARIRKLQPYREGRMELKGIRSDFLNNIQDTVERAQTQAFIEMSRLCLCGLIVDAITDDMAVDSFIDLTMPVELPDPDAAEVEEGEDPSLAPHGGQDITPAASVEASDASDGDEAATADGRGIYESHLPVIDRINFSVYERLVLMDKQAFRELWIKGLPAFYENPETGEREIIDWSKVILRGPGNANLLPGDSTDVEETGEADFTQITAAVFNDVKYLAAVTSTPLYILDPSAAQESALGADKADKVHRTRIRTLRVSVGEALAEAMSLSFEATGEPGKEFETVWSPLEDETLAQRAQSAAVLQSIIPQRSLWTDVLQLTPEQISRAEAGLIEDRINKILDGVAEAKAAAQAQQIEQVDAPAADAHLDDTGDETTPAEQDTQELSHDLVESLGLAEGNAVQLSGDESTFTKSRAGKGTGANTAAVFLIDYLQDHGGEAPAADIQRAALEQGYRSSTVKVARTRMKDRVLTVRRTNGKGGFKVWWQLNTKNVHDK